MTTGSASRAWTFFSLIGLGAWIAAVVVVSINTDPASDSKAPLRTAAVGGAIFFGMMFAAVGIGMRRARWKGTTALYDQLATHDIDRDALKAANRGTSTIGYAYLAFGVLTTGIMLAAVWFADDDITSNLVMIVSVLLVIWLAFMIYAFRKVFVSSNVMFGPLGLAVTQMPVYVPSSAGGGTLAGSMTYEGMRHGRHTSIVHTTGGSVTHLEGPIHASKATNTPNQMAALTGQPITCWRKVKVQVDADGVTVARRGNGAGKWFLHDLLLAERAAGV